MLHNIEPRIYNCAFGDGTPKPTDIVLLCKGEDILFLQCGEEMKLPRYAFLQDILKAHPKPTYLFSIDNCGFFGVNARVLPQGSGLAHKGAEQFRQMEPSWQGFGGSVACQLMRWYAQHTYCGLCAAPMQPGTKERVLACQKCGHMEYPKISPAVIVAITNGERVLLSKYANRSYQRHALIAGFMEIGESLEDTVRREVMEEVGLNVKNIRYYGNQPWPFTDSLLVGFFADLDGSEEIHLDENELAMAEWVHRDDIPVGESKMSLTRTMMEAFRDKEYPLA